MRRALACLAGWLVLTSAASPPPVALDLILGDTLPAKLSDFRFFTDAKAMKPNARVAPYTLNTPLFSDYAEKYRFMFVPPGKRAGYGADGLLDFPIGTALIKSFGYPGRPVIETRVLLRRTSGWVALPYVWEGDDAVLKRGGKRLPVEWTDAKGARRSISYAVPNQNQCKGCHAQADALVPIGPKVRNLNDGAQLTRLMQAGVIEPVLADFERLPRWDDPASGGVDARARAYLDVNCAHCHSRKGPASNSGLYLEYQEQSAVARGVGKRPVAAGRGSGGFDFAIEPGAPARSILLFRMKTTEPGLAMPELGRATVHEEAVALLSEWIDRMPKQ